MSGIPGEENSNQLNQLTPFSGCDDSCKSSDTDQLSSKGCHDIKGPFIPDGADASNQAPETFAQNDLSWPCLKNVYAPSQADLAKLYYIVPGSYLDNMFHVSRMGFDAMGPSVVEKDQAKPTYSVQKYSYGDSRVYTEWQARINYQGSYPDTTSPLINPCADTSFDPPSVTKFHNFYFSATMTGNYFVMVLKPSFFDAQKGSKACFDGGEMGCSQKEKDHTQSPTWAGAYAINSMTAFQKQTCVVPSENSITTGGQYCITGCSDTTNHDVYTTHAHMRDGMARLPSANTDVQTFSEKCQNQELWQPGGQEGWSGMWYTGYSKKVQEKSFAKAKNPNTMCGSSGNPPNSDAMYLMDMDSGKNIQRKFLQLEIQDPTIQFAQISHADNKLLLHSFNVMGRQPTCNSKDDVNPTQSHKYSKDYKSMNCMSGSSPSWTWTSTRPTKGNNWPNLENDKSPDIVVRVLFYNKYVWSPSQGTPISLTTDAIREFKANIQSIWQQNMPQAALSSQLDSLLMDGFMRGMAFLEYVSTIVYSLFFGYRLENNAQRTLYYQLSQHCIVPSGKFTMTDYLKFLFKLWTINTTNSIVPVGLGGSANNITQELQGWAHELVTSTSKYLKRPWFFMQGSNLYLGMWVHPMMHVDLLQAQNPDVNVNIYLNNYFQDMTSMSASNIGDSYSRGTIGQVEIQTKDTTFGGPSGIPIQVVHTTFREAPIEYTSGQTSYSVAFEYTAEVQTLSPASVLYLLQNQNIPLDSLHSLASYLTASTALPQPLVLLTSTQNACLTQDKITKACKGILCSGVGECICDYSVLLDGVSVNPQSSLYANNSLGPCACLAANSYAKASEGGSRASNTVAMCFAKACEGKVEFLEDDFCANQGCSQFQQDLDLQHLSQDQWYDLFPDEGKGVDVNLLNQTCQTDIVPKGSLRTDSKFIVNWYILAASILLGLALPFGLMVDYIGLKQRRPPVVYWVVLGLSLVFLGLAGVLFYALTGVHTCDKIGYDETTTAPCKDRLFRKLSLSQEACQKKTMFCQCTKFDSKCPKYDVPATCTNKGVCAVCPDNVDKIDVTSFPETRTQLPTTWMYLMTSGVLFVMTIVGLVLAKRLQSRGWSMFARVLLTTMLGLGMFGLGLGGIIMATNRTKITTTQIDKHNQRVNYKTKHICQADAQLAKKSKR